MARKTEVDLTALILALCGEPTARLERRDDGRYSLNSSAGARCTIVQ